ncbi:DUF58 domain-containing protein [Halosquirtibacter xylanolyticus]|uniref:DUF58 domain-containing protein n=1 Tax=Halosquirtibacter xylanolyticus TaxID=3374599 RepID=UPI003748E5A0|nr:DUF58 domain-containing protein [Prolixibacteraceae bacterium]
MKTHLSTTINEDHRIVTNNSKLQQLQYDIAKVGFSPKKVVQTILTGSHKSKLRGRGMDFEEVRNYAKGDDVRNIDWKVTGRTDELHSKVFTEERERPVFIITDQCSSMFLGTKEYLKSVIAVESAALIAWKVLAVGDRIGGLIYNDTNKFTLPPRKNKSHVLTMIDQLTDFNHALLNSKVLKPNDNTLGEIIFEIKKRITHDYLVVWISDFNQYRSSHTKDLVALSEHNDVILVQVSDPLETNFNPQQITFSNGDDQFQFERSSEKRVKRVTNHFKEKQNQLEALSTNYPITLLKLSTESSATHQFKEILRKSR